MKGLLPTQNKNGVKGGVGPQSSSGGLVGTLINFCRSLLGKKVAPELEEEPEELCCSGKVHVAYRGVSDDRLYLSYSRQWSEVRYFRPNGLKVFCADCRRRLL